MTKLLRRTLIIISGLMGILLISAFGFLFKFQSETKNMTPLLTGKVVDGVFVIKNQFVNFYFFQQNNHLIAIDAGTDLNASKNEIQKLDINPEKVEAIFLTHTDSDHVAAVPLFKNAKIYISQDEEQMVNGKTHRQLIFNNSLNYKHELLSDNEFINIDQIKIQAIATPGHTPGSMSYLINDQYLFTGDLLSLKNGKAQIFNLFFNMDTETEKNSIRKIKNYPTVKYILSAHYGFTGDPVKALRAW